MFIYQRVIEPTKQTQEASPLWLSRLDPGACLAVTKQSAAVLRR
jgi:hypothetical protein